MDLPSLDNLIQAPVQAKPDGHTLELSQQIKDLLEEGKDLESSFSTLLQASDSSEDNESENIEAQIAALIELQSKINNEVEKLSYQISQAEQTDGDTIIEKADLIDSLTGAATKLQSIIGNLKEENVELVKNSLASIEDFKSQSQIKELVQSISKLEQELDTGLSIPSKDLLTKPDKLIETSQKLELDLRQRAADQSPEQNISELEAELKDLKLSLKQIQGQEILKTENTETKTEIDKELKLIDSLSKSVAKIKNNVTEQVKELTQSLEELKNNSTNKTNNKNKTEELSSKVIDLMTSVKDKIKKLANLEYTKSTSSNNKVQEMVNKIETHSKLSKIAIMNSSVESQITELQEASKALPNKSKASNSTESTELLETDSSNKEQVSNLSTNKTELNQAKPQDVKINKASQTTETLSIREMLNKIESKSSKVSNDSSEEMKIKLNPGKLGEITVRISRSNNQISIQMTVDNDSTLKLMKSELAELNNSLKSKGIEVKDLEVSKSEQSNNAKSSQDNDSRQNDAREEQKQRLLDKMPGWLKTDSTKKPSFKSQVDGILN